MGLVHIQSSKSLRYHHARARSLCLQPAVKVLVIAHEAQTNPNRPLLTSAHMGRLEINLWNTPWEINGWNIIPWRFGKIIFLSKWMIRRFHVNLPGGTACMDFSGGFYQQRLNSWICSRVVEGSCCASLFFWGWGGVREAVVPTYILQSESLELLRSKASIPKAGTVGKPFMRSILFTIWYHMYLKISLQCFVIQTATLSPSTLPINRPNHKPNVTCVAVWL